MRLPIGTTRLESQAFRRPRGGPMEAALTLWSFPVKRKGRKNTPPDLKIRRLDGPCGGPIILALTFCSFLVKQKGRKTFHFTSPTQSSQANILPHQETSLKTSTLFPFIQSTIIFGKKPKTPSPHKSSSQPAKPSSFSNSGRPIRTSRRKLIPYNAPPKSKMRRSKDL